MYCYQFIIFTFLFRAPSLHTEFQLQDLWSCALASKCQKLHLTAHTHTHTHTHSYTHSLTHTHTHTLTHTHSITHTLTHTHTHTHITIPQHPTDYNHTTRYSPSHHHEPRKTNVCWMMLQCTDFGLSFPLCFHEGESIISTWYFLAPLRKE